MTWLLLMAGAGLAGCAGDYGDNDRDDDDDDIGPVAYNPTCAELGLGGYSSRIEAVETGTYSLDGALGGVNTVTLGTNGTYLAFGTSIGVDAVIVKGGPSANVYTYGGESGFDLGLSPPINPATREPYEISHVELCFDYEAAVTVEAGTALKRTIQWAIAKTSPIRQAQVASQQILSVPYRVVVTSPGFFDGERTVAGKLAIRNPSPFPAEITGVIVRLAHIRAPEPEMSFRRHDVCPPVPFTLAPGETVECAYVLKASDALTGTVTAEVTTAGEVGAGFAAAPFDFAAAAVVVRDACVDVGDDHVGMLGRTCKPRVYDYTLDLGPMKACGVTRTVKNVAQLFTPDSGAVQTAVWSVDLTVPRCPPGCTLGQGYWKTHSVYGPASADATWNLLPAGADTPFFGGASFHDVLWTPTGGNIYYTLARHYIAAYLNVLGDADDAPIAGVLDDATDLFRTYTPAQVASWRDAALRNRLLDDAAILEQYNEGRLGPPRCTADGSYE